MATVQVIFEGQDKNFTANVQKIQKEMDGLSKKLKEAGVSSAAYNQAIAKQNQANVGAVQSIKNFASANAALIGGIAAVGTAIAKSYQAFQQYAGAVRDVALASGSSAEEASKLIQVLDDYEISAQDVLAATKAMTKNGMEPSIDTLATLSDEYIKIQDPMQKNEFILKNLGKAGLQWANALNQGGDALRASSEEVSKSLILTDEQIKKAEMARLAVDSWADAWEGLKVTIGGAVGGIIATSAENKVLAAQFQELTGLVAQKAPEAFEKFKVVMEKAGLSTEYYKKMYSDMAKSVVDDSAEMQKARADEISSAISIQKANDSYNQSQDKITQSLQKEQAELDRLNQGYYAYTGANAAAATELANITNKINAFVPGVTGSQQELHKMMQTQSLLNGMLAGEEPILVKNTGEIEKQTEVVKELQEAQRVAAEEFAKAQGEKLAMMAVELIAMSDGVAGFSEAEAAKAQAILDTAGVAEAAAFREARAFETAAAAIADGTTSATELNELLTMMSEHGWTIDVAVNVQKQIDLGSGVGTSTAAEQAAGLVHGQWRGGDVGRGAGIPWLARGGSAGAAVVGDRQGGGWVDGVSELVFGNFTVVPSGKSKKILQSGALGKIPGFAFGGDMGGYTSAPPIAPVYTPSMPRVAPSKSGGDPISSAMQFVETQAVDMQASTQNAVVQMAQVTQQMTQSILNSNAQNQVILEDIAAILKHENPRAVGRAVAYEVAKGS